MENLFDYFSCGIFDLDGTLLDSTNVWEQIDYEFLGKRGIVPPKDYIDEIKVHNFESGAKYTVERFGLGESYIEILNEWFEMAEHHYANDIMLKPGALDYLKKLKANGVTIAAATANDEKLFIPCLERNGVIDLFDSFTQTSEVERKKGYPDVYIRAMEKSKKKTEDCVVFEDILAGIRGANNGGFYTVAVMDKCSGCDEEIIKKESNRYIVDFKELL